MKMSEKLAHKIKVISECDPPQPEYIKCSKRTETLKKRHNKIKLKATEWHYPSRGEYPQYQYTSEGIEYCPLVLILVQMGNQMNVYALDRYSPNLKAWDKFHDRLVRAWMPLPEPPKEKE